MLFRNSLLALLAGTATAVHAAHPLITEDTGTQGKGGWQLELNAERQRDAGASATQWGSTLSYGFVDSADVQVGLPYRASEGRGDLAIDVKWRFFQREVLSLGLKPGVTLPTGDEERRLGTGRTTAGSLLILSYEPEIWSFHAHAGYRQHRNSLGDPEARRHLSGSLWLKPSAKLKLVSDLSYDSGSGATLRQYVLGVIYSVTKDFDIDAGLRRGNAPAVDRALLAGITVRW